MGILRDVLIVLVSVAVWLLAIWAVTKSNMRSGERARQRAARKAVAAEERTLQE